MHRLITCLLLLILCHAMPILAAEDESEPLWELGLIGGGGWKPDYPASDEYHPAGLVLPYVRYRGKIFRAGDRDAIARGRFLRNKRYEFDLSLSGALPADSDKNDARRDMPDLDALIEVGPRFQLTLAEPLPRSKLSFEIPARAVFSIALDGVGYHGFTFHPRLVYQHDNLFGVLTRFRVTTGPIFATKELMDYFYQVKERDEIVGQRPAFDAAAGYLGSEFSLYARRRLSRHLSIFGALKVNYYEGATNADSPLFRTNTSAAVGLGFIWSIYLSKQQTTDR